jgi:hypothetical protein
MDRLRTLEKLDQLIELAGAVVLFRNRHPEVSANAWQSAYQDVLSSYVCDDEAWRRRRSSDWLTSEAVSLESPFSQLERIGVIERHTVPVETFVDRSFFHVQHESESA